VQKTGTGLAELIEAACGKMFPGVKRIHSSRPHGHGVHALGMVRMWRFRAQNSDARPAGGDCRPTPILPDDIAWLSAVRVPAAFHARFDATGKQYRYFVWNHASMNPLLQNRAWHFR